MDSQNIHRASEYINNLLLARGLLRDGTKIDFAPPSKHHKPTQPPSSTAAQTINLIHDLILRHDASTSQRETLSSTLHNLHSTSSQSTTQLETLRAERASLARQLALAQGRERAADVLVRKAEAAAKRLRDEMVRLKVCLGQVRITCANDVRKRDVQIGRLKGLLTMQQRGSRQPLSASTITITTGSQLGVMGGAGSVGVRREEEVACGLDSPEYSLRQETTEFLTSLSQSLSDENDNLIALVRESLVALRAMQGLSAGSIKEVGMDECGESISSSDGSRIAPGQALPDYETLANDMHHVLDHLRTLLTNPSFVPIEEVEAREDEIIRLREGWEKMEERWREAVGLIDGWRKRMAEGGQVKIEELKMGLGLGVGLDGVVKREDDGAEWEDEEGGDINEAECADSASGSPEIEANQERQPAKEWEDKERNNNDEDQYASITSKSSKIDPTQDAQSTEPQNKTHSPSELPEHPAILRETNPNARPEPSPHKVSFDFSLAEGESIDELALLEISSPTPAPRRRSIDKSSPRRSSSVKSRLKPERVSSPTSIQQKLKEVEAEAEAVRAAKVDESVSSGPKTAARKGGRRKRKSTLSPEELESLIGGF